jgi:hypothetical protein
MKSVEARWRTFRLLVIHPDAPPVQVNEMQIAFYAGCKSMLDAVAHLERFDQVAAGRELEKMRAEVRRFGGQIDDQQNGESQ